MTRSFFRATQALFLCLLLSVQVVYGQATEPVTAPQPPPRQEPPPAEPLPATTDSSQTQTSTPVPSQGRRQGAARPSGPNVYDGPTFKITGRVVDAATNQAVPFTTVSVLRADSSLVTGSLAGENGRFEVDKVPPGVYRVRIGFIGYSNFYVNDVRVSPNQPATDLGTLPLAEKRTQLKEVVIEAERPMMTLGIDRKTFDVGRMTINPGGSATDVLGTIPTVSVDGDGNVSLRNNENVTIYIDGRPSGITAQNKAQILRQIPASAIERIELITSPSARYDAEGISGIINIITKKNKLEGINGSVQAGIGTRNKYNGAVNLNYRSKKVATYLNYNFRDNQRFGRSTFDRQTIIPSDNGGAAGGFFSSQKSNSERYETNNMFKAGIDFFLPREWTIGGSASLAPSREREEENTNYTYFTNPSLPPYRTARREVDGNSKSLNFDAVISARKKYDNAGHELSSDVSYSQFSNDEATDFLQLGALQTDTLSSFINAPVQQTNNNNNTKVLLAQVDYVRPIIDKKSKLELGAKSTTRSIRTDFSYFAGNNEGALEEVTIQRNDFEYNEQIIAGYSQLARQWERIGLMAGLRAEQTWVRPRLLSQPSEKRDQVYFALFPTANLSYKLTKTADLQASFSRRINRPQGQNLNPFADYDDPTTLRTGNPNLKPEYIYAYELAWAYNPGPHSLILTGFYRYTDALQTRVISVDTTGRALVTFDNVGTRQDAGLEAVARFQISKGFAFTGSGSLFGAQIDAPNVSTGIVRNNTNWNVRAMINYNFKFGLNVQATTNYRSPFILPQGVSQPMYSTEIALTQDMFKKKASLSFAVNDIFNTMQFGIRTSDVTFAQEILRKRETRVATVTFTYRFGSVDNLTRRREGRGGRDGGGRDSGGGGDFGI